MPSRHRSRQRALQVLYQAEVSRISPHQALDNFYLTLHSSEREDEDNPAQPGRDEFMESLVRGTMSQTASIDARIVSHSANWRLERMPLVDRNILRVAVYEMMGAGTPAAVVIDEALELARQFSGESSVAFINGVLDAVRKELTPANEPRQSASNAAGE